MTPQQIELVRTTFAAVAPQADAVAAAFYQRLFTLDPALKPMFRGDMAQQGRKLMTVLSAGVAHLDRLADLGQTLRAMGARHSFYGVRDEHYDTVGRALLDTLKQGLGDAFEPAVQQAWACAYAELTGMMRGTRSAPLVLEADVA